MKLTRLDPQLAQRLQDASASVARQAVADALADRDAVISDLRSRLAAAEAALAKIKAGIMVAFQ
jgi:predicted transcriptional regulator